MEVIKLVSKKVTIKSAVFTFSDSFLWRELEGILTDSRGKDKFDHARQVDNFSL